MSFVGGAEEPILKKFIKVLEDVEPIRASLILARFDLGGVSSALCRIDRVSVCLRTHY